MLSRLSKHLVVLIPASMAAGLIAGLIVDLAPLKVLIVPLTMLMVWPMLVSFRPSEALSLAHGRSVALAMALDLLALPVLAWAIALVFFRNEPGLFVGIVLAGLFPTSGMTISWTGFAGGNVAAAVKMTVVGLLAASALAPLYLLVFAGRTIPVDALSVAGTVGLVVIVPMVAGSGTRIILTRRYGSERFNRDIAPLFPGISTIGVLAIVFLAVGLRSEMIVSDPLLLARVLLPLVLFYAANFAVSTIVGRTLLPRGDAIALVFGTVMRNLSIALGVAVASFGPEAAFVLALAYVIQVQSAAWYVKLAPRIFGPLPSVEGPPSGRSALGKAAA